ncbi:MULTISPECIES: FMN-binding glutamate synthase family protein [unclassified Pseudoalteromonas]|uniref:FMN-binding glutamate synthase family protein n=2 Tax=Pseudoalteromonas TaxID=53246 RepID=UPI001C71937D|nr:MULTISPECIES: FMN-binding glutamate synthase family protein [unclassified Pseudoalteromonas]|tara:strand:+ start:866 stop:2539 length:1674 start_codon:yes stop_codon:yes gene_type:complete
MKQMASFFHLLMRAFLPISALIVLVLVLFLNPYNYLSIFVIIIAGFFVALGIKDRLQTSSTLLRNYPVIAWIRHIFYDLRPFLRQYIVEDDLEGTPYSFEARNLIYARSQGKSDTRPLGTERNVKEDGYTWVCHSMAPKSQPDTKPRVTIGNEQSSQPYEASLLNISAMSFGALSGRAVEALNKGAKIGDFYHDTGEGGLSEYHKKHGGDIVWELGTGYFGCRDEHGNFDPKQFADTAQSEQVKMTEIKLSQGAKPGHGGLLPGSKVTEEIARTRKVPAHEDCLSPAGHSAFSTPVELLEFAQHMRELSGGKPVGLKLCVGMPHEVMALGKAMLSTEIYPDFIVVDGAEGGTGAAPNELSDWVGMPLEDGLVMMQNMLVGTGLRKHIKLGASGKIYNGMGMAKHIALGADWCNAARAFMFSIGCVQAKRCDKGTCPTGITTQDPQRQRSLDIEIQSQRAALFHSKTLAALGEIVGSCGGVHPSELDPHQIITRIDAAQSKSIMEVHPFLPPNSLLDTPGDTAYCDWWEAASKDTFKPIKNLTDAMGTTLLAHKRGHY